MRTNDNNETAHDLHGLAWALTRPDEFRYQLLSRMQSDCEYNLGFGQIYGNHLWVGSGYPEDQIEVMKGLWQSFTDKPEWLSLEQIEAYKTKMLTMKRLWQDLSDKLPEATPETSSVFQSADRKTELLNSIRTLIGEKAI